MEIRLGTLGIEKVFAYVNIESNLVKPGSEHLMISGTMEMQEAVNYHEVYTVNFVYLTKSKLDELKSLYTQAGSSNLQIQDEEFLIDHTVKFRSGSLTYAKSKSMPPDYEASAVLVEVG